MRWTPASRTVVLAVLAGLTAFQLIGLVTALVSASRERVTDFGIIGPGLGNRSDLNRIRALGGLPVDSVAGPALDAGLLSGDVIIAIDSAGMVKRPGVWYRGRFTTPPGAELRLLVRSGAALVFPELRTRRLADPLRWPFGPAGPDRPSMDYRVAHWWWYGPSLLMSLLLFVVGLAIGLLRRNDPTAWTFALVFLGISLATSIGPGTPLLHVWPPWLVVFWGLTAIAGTAYSMPLTIYGLADFPAPTPLSTRFRPYRWVPFAALGATGAAECVMALATYGNVSTPEQLQRIGRVVDVAFNTSLALGFATMGVLLAAHRFERAGSGGERLKVLWYGAMSAVVGGLWSVLIPDAFWHQLTRPLGSTGAWVGQFLDDVAPALLVCLLPLSFAYTILARRLFGIRFVIRRGLQHLLLSRGVLVVEGVVLFLILEQSIRRGAAVAVQGPAMAGVLALLVVSGIAVVNRPLMQALDRRFFRDRYDARRVMLGLGQELALLRERDEILRRVGEAIMAALHPARAGIYLRAEDGGRLDAAWLSGQSGDDEAARGIAAAEAEREAAALSARLSVAGTDRIWQETEPSSGIGGPSGRTEGTPFMEHEAVRRPPPYELGIQIRQSGRVAGCIALAGKLSEEPYTSEDRELLLTVAQQAALALENADLLAVARREAQFSREVEIAREVQRNLFPRELPELPGWEVAAVCRPARRVAGDYYDVLRGVDGSLGVALGDVSGKGIGASLLSAGVHAMVRSRLPGAACDLGVLLQDLNAHLIESSADDMFATIVVARIDPADGRMAYVNAGHPAPLLVTANGPLWLTEGGPLAGVIPRATYATGEVRFEPGDLLVIYSDGVAEAERSEGEMFGDEQLLAAMTGARGRSASEALAAVLGAVEAFAGAGEPADDISLIMVRRVA